MRHDVIAWGSALAYWFVAVVCTLVAAISWRRRRLTTAGTHLAVTMVGCAAWALADVPTALATSHRTSLAAARVGISIVLPSVAVTVAGLWCLSRGVAVPEWRPSRRTAALLAVHPVVMVVLPLSDPWTHAVFAPGPEVTARGWLAWSMGWAFWLHTGYSYLLLSAGMVNLGRAWLHGSSLQRRQAGALMLAGLIPLPANLLTIALLPGGTPEITGLAFALTGIIDAYALLRLQVGKIVPVARSLVFRRLHDAVLVISPEGRLLDANDAAVTLLRTLAPSLPGTLAGVNMKEVGREIHHELLLGSQAADNGWVTGEFQVQLPTGRAVLDLRIEKLTDRRGRPLARLVVVRDISELHDQREQLAEANRRLREQLRTIEGLRADLAEQAIRDELTGLHNRRHLVARLDEAVATAWREHRDLCVVMIDVDHFKSVNDRYGHATGDALLTGIAGALASSVGGDETLARYGGEEFVALLPGASPTQAVARAQEWRLRCGEVVVPTALGPVSRTASIGVTSLVRSGSPDEVTPGRLLQEADEALYAAKEAGRNRVVMATGRATPATRDA